MMLRRRCACGGIVVAPEAMDRWPEHVLAHVRTERHREWSALALSDVQPVVTLFGQPERDGIDAYERRRVA